MNIRLAAQIEGVKAAQNATLVALQQVNIVV